MSAPVNGSPAIQGAVTQSGPLPVVTHGIALSPSIISTVLHERMNRSRGATCAGSSGFALTIWATYLSATFHAAFGLTGDLVTAVFLVFGALTTVVAVVTFISFIWNYRRSSVESIVDEIIRRSTQ